MQQLTVPIAKNSNNKSAFWATKGAWKKQILNDVWACVKEQKIKPVTEYPIQLFFTFYFVGRLLDCDNCGGVMVKGIIDGLRYSKIITNDSPKQVEQIGIRVEKSKRKHDYCVVEID